MLPSSLQALAAAARRGNEQAAQAFLNALQPFMECQVRRNLGAGAGPSGLDAKLHQAVAWATADSRREVDVADVARRLCHGVLVRLCGRPKGHAPHWAETTLA